MVETYWYCYDRTGDYSPPYFETRGEAADACDGGEVPRPISASLLDGDPNSQPETKDVAIARGECPWCDDYDGDYIAQHASSAHPNAWDRYNDN